MYFDTEVQSLKYVKPNLEMFMEMKERLGL